MESEDNSEETLELLRRWNIPAIPPEKIIESRLVGACSRPIRKQLTESDINGEELMLAMSPVKKKFLPLLEEESEIHQGQRGKTVSLYGPYGKLHDTETWMINRDSLDSITGWRKFVGEYELKENCDFITVWMFIHEETHEFCLAIDRTRISLQKQLSQRISKAVFGD
ncbi:putative B3 domain-containing protein [Raphanus sativus]|uniref:B3 domain-containing protein At4g03170 n=1 Tax=Raphanus sativus TaxID=3726 RepID=A0A6J0LJZ2_RAPSA|nr:putative B3 domain-containing protein At4g03170 [Raphanus sativus]KAJ4879899.1 putative B3 domain-containing protein [Raphanus sativus]